MNEQYDNTFDATFPTDVSPQSSVEAKIHAIVKQMSNVNYVFENWTTANVKADKIDYPAVINVLPVSGSINLNKNKLRDYPNCIIAFVDKTDLDFDGTENESIVDKCKALAMEFILTANASGLFEQIDGDIPYSVIYDQLDVNVTGVSIELQLKETQGTVLCYGKPIKDYFK